MDTGTARSILRARELEIPESFAREVEARGGAINWHTFKVKSGRVFRVAVVRKPDPRGRRTLSYEIK